MGFVSRGIVLLIAIATSACGPLGSASESPGSQPSPSAFPSADETSPATITPSQSGTATAVAPTITPHAPISTPSPSIPSGDPWEAVDLPFLPNGVVANDDGYLAYAALGGAAFSQDARYWMPVEVDGVSFWATAAAASRDVFALVGYDDDHDLTAVVGDGTTWRSAPLTLPDAYQIAAMASDGNGFIAIGSGAYGQASGPPIALRSADGLLWREIGVPPVEELVAVAADGNGYMAIGSTRDTITFASETISSWQLAEDGEWTSLPFVAQVCCKPMAMAAANRTYVAAGAGDCADRLIGAGWYRPAGADAWRRSAHSGDLEEAFLWTVSRFEGGFVAAGSVGQAFEETRVAIWTSTDGSRWDRRAVVTQAGAWGVKGVASGPAGLVVVGFRGGELADFGAFAWILPAGAEPGRSPADAPAVDTGCDVSRSGTGWRAIDLEGWFSTYEALPFMDATVAGMPARRAVSTDQELEVLLLGDAADVSRIEVRTRGSASDRLFLILDWLGDDAWIEQMYDVVEGRLDRAESVIESLAVSFEPSANPDWDFVFVGMPAR